MRELEGLWTLRIRHEFFGRRANKWGAFRLSRESENMLRRRGCMLKEVVFGEWRLLSLSKDSLVFNRDDKLELDYYVSIRNMSYITELPWKRREQYPLIRVDASKNVVVKMDKPPGEMVHSCQNIEFKLIVSLQGLDYNRMAVTEIQYIASSHYLEYFFVPNDRNIDRKLEIETLGAELKFVEIKDCTLDIGFPYLHFRSTGKFKLREKTRIQAVLYERLRNGIRKPLMHGLPTPVMGNFPIDYGIASAIVYF